METLLVSGHTQVQFLDFDIVTPVSRALASSLSVHEPQNLLWFIADSMNTEEGRGIEYVYVCESEKVSD